MYKIESNQAMHTLIIYVYKEKGIKKTLEKFRRKKRFKR